MKNHQTSTKKWRVSVKTEYIKKKEMGTLQLKYVARI